MRFSTNRPVPCRTTTSENLGLMAVDRGSGCCSTSTVKTEECSAPARHEPDGAGVTWQIARYPVYNPNLGGLVTLQKRVNYCWEINLDQFPLTRVTRT